MCTSWSELEGWGGGGHDRAGVSLFMCLCSLARRDGNHIPTRFLAPIDCSKIPALYVQVDILKCKMNENFIKETVKDAKNWQVVQSKHNTCITDYHINQAASLIFVKVGSGFASGDPTISKSSGPDGSNSDSHHRINLLNYLLPRQCGTEQTDSFQTTELPPFSETHVVVFTWVVSSTVSSAKPEFVNLLRSPGIDSHFPPLRAGTTTLFDVPARQAT